VTFTSHSHLLAFSCENLPKITLKFFVLLICDITYWQLFFLTLIGEKAVADGRKFYTL
jgi:hypothetical protein